jgi:hypothetical protein
MHLAHVSGMILCFYVRARFNERKLLTFLGPMGKTSDPASVIDSKAQVIGVQGLRVVDASSFPLLPPGHPQSTVCEFEELFRRY